VPTLHPKGVNHLAIATRDMKTQLTFWNEVLGCPTKALYWMHNVDNVFHGFVELSPESYVAFVQDENNPKEPVWGVSHAGNPGGPVTAGATQHIALHVDTFDELLSMRDRIRSHGIIALGPLDHGFIQSIYFAGPEGLSLEIACGRDIDERAWIDPEVQQLCDISAEEIESLKHPQPFERPVDPVQQPDADPDKPVMHYADDGAIGQMIKLSDEFLWENMSDREPPVAVEEDAR